MATILKRTRADGTVAYCAQIRLAGFLPESSTWDKEVDAKRWAKGREAELLKQPRTLPGDENKPPERTVNDLIEAYCKRVLPFRAKNTRRHRASSLKWWAKEIGTRPLKSLTTGTFAELRDKLLTEGGQTGKPLGSGTVAQRLIAILHALRIACKEWGWLEKNPMDGVKLPKAPKGRVRFLSDDERERLLQAAGESRQPALYPIVVLALYTGMRSSEIVGLTWDRIDFARRRAWLDETKNGDRRSVPLAKPALDALKEWQSRRFSGQDNVIPFQRWEQDTTLVFPGFHRGTLRPLHFESSWKFARKQAGLGGDVCFHTCRHTAASYLLMSGASLIDVAKILGHKSLRSTMIYSHLADDHLDDVVNRMADKFGVTG